MIRIFTLFTLLLLLIPGDALAKKKTGKKRKARQKIEVEIPLNIGVGVASPTFFGSPLEGSPNLHTGIALDLYAAIPPTVLEANKNKIPKKFRKYVNSKSEIQIRPLWLALVPGQIYISPKREKTGIYGATWSFFGLSSTLGDADDFFALKMGVHLPSITYAFLDSDKLIQNKHLLGLGGSLKARLFARISKTLILSTGWSSHLYLPIVSTQLDQKDGIPKNLVHMGVITVMLHMRFPIKQKI